MNVDEVMKELETMGNETTKKIFMRHGAREPFFGVKIADLKKILKKEKKNHSLALELYETGNSDAMYLAGLMAEPFKMKKADLKRWVKKAYWYMLSEYTMGNLAAESLYGRELALEWIDSRQEMTASAGWAAYSGVIALKETPELDLGEITSLMERVEMDIRQAENRVRYSMNNFIISVGCYIPELKEKAVVMAERIGKVKVDMGDTSCKVPYAPEYIKKVASMGKTGKKRKAVRC